MKKPFTVQLTPEILSGLENLAKENHTTPTQLVTQALGFFTEIEPREFSTALGVLKNNFPKRGPGRPATTTRRTAGNAAQPA